MNVEPPPLLPVGVIVTSVLRVGNAIVLDLTDAPLSPDRVVKNLAIEDIGLENIEAPALGPQGVILLAVVRIQPPVNLNFGKIAPRPPHGVVKHLPTQHVGLKAIQSPALRPQRVILLAVIRIQPPVNLNLVQACIAPI
jgi:hypothetical protein